MTGAARLEVDDESPGTGAPAAPAERPVAADLLGTSRGRRRLVPTMLTSFAMPLSAAVTGPVFARTIGASGRGVVTAVSAPVVLLAGIIGAGLQSTVAYFSAGRPELLAAVLRRSWAIAVVAGACAGALLVAAVPLFVRNAPGHELAAVLCAALLPLMVLGRASRAAALAQGRVGLVNATVMAAALARTVVVLVLAVRGDLGIGAAVAVLMGYEVFLSFPVLVRSLAWARAEPAPAADLTRRMARYGGLATLGSLAAVVTLRLDLVVLAPLVPTRDLGLYVFAFGLTELWAGCVRSSVTVVLPEAVRTRDVAAVAQLTRVLTAASVVAVAGSVVAGDAVVGVVFGAGYERTAHLLPLLLAGSSVFALEGLPGTLLLAEGSPGRRSIGQLVGGAVTVVGLVLVVPRHGIEGAAAVSTVAYTLAAVITTAQVAVRTSVPWHRFVVLRPSDLRRRRPGPGGSPAPGVHADGAPPGGTGSASPATVDVIVPSWDRSDDLDRCLAGLAAQTHSADRVLVVLRPEDGASHEVVQRWTGRLGGLEVVAAQRPGQVAALNAALGFVEGDVVVILDDDAVADADWVERACARFRSDPGLGGVCGRDRLSHRGVAIAGLTGRRVGSLTWFGRLTGLFHLGPDEALPVAHLKGCAMAYRADAVRGLRFDERLRGSGAQPLNDTAFSMEVAARGWRLLYDPALAVDHRHGARHGRDVRISEPGGAFVPTAAADWVHNETLVVLSRRGALGRATARLWLETVGSRVNPGVVQALRAVPNRGTTAARHWWVAVAARREAARTLRSAGRDKG